MTRTSAGSAPARQARQSPDAGFPGPTQFLADPVAVRAFILREWERELDYRLKRELWAYDGDRVSIQVEYDWLDPASGDWVRSRGEESWVIAADGTLRRQGARLAHSAPGGAGPRRRNGQESR
jgi:nuclear transport factor 2 (NTF2) superfamily protein